mmetsp:Transcript_21126/g.47201  ORF Transcript_21126/g.47201 Transcript_21126/m.47201 type:complete len:234 (+) Transcript_21126:666-1367(+)
MKLAISTTIAFVLCIVLSVGASASIPSDTDATEPTDGLANLLTKPGINADAAADIAADLTEHESANANLRGGRNLGSYCKWNGKKYGHGEWAYDCDAKYDKCQCKCDSWGGGCKWKNCHDDDNYCGWDGGGGWGDDDDDDDDTWPGGGGGGGGVKWKKYEQHACRKYGTYPGKEDHDYKKYHGKSSDWCKKKCEGNDWCKAFEWSKNKYSCEIWKTKPKDEEWKDGVRCYKKK